MDQSTARVGTEISQAVGLADGAACDAGAPASPGPSPLEAFSGTISPTQVSALYKAGLALVALGMVLLPVCYVGLIALVAMATWFHLKYDTFLVTQGHGMIPALIYIAPLVAALVVIYFMLKPLFAKRPAPPITFTLECAKEPLLFSFIEQICLLVRAPVPKRVDVNCEVNASASFRRGLFNLVGSNLVLTIGLPLAAGLNLREFAGVLAHEFGHFSQGAGMRFGYIIRLVNLWFARVVYELGQAYEELLRGARGKDIRLVGLIYCAVGAVWTTREILTALMKAGHTISCFMQRQMEYDADSYECKVAGSDTLEPTMLRLRTLNLAAQSAFGDLRESWRSGRLPDDFPAFVNRKAAMFSPELLQKIRQAAAESKTKTFDTHPGDADRVCAAHAANAPGVFRLTEPAASLFANFPRLCHEVTRFYYEKQQRLHVREQNLVKVEQSSRESVDNVQRQRALESYLHGINTAFFPVRLSPEQLVPLPDWQVSVRNLSATREQLAAAAPRAHQALKEHVNADALWIKAASAHHLLQCGFSIPAQQFGLPTATLKAAAANLDLSNAEMDRTGVALRDFAQAASQRVGAAMQLLAEPSLAARIAEAASLRQEAPGLAKALLALGQASEALHKIRRRLPGLELLLNNRKNHKDPAKVDRQIHHLAGELKGLLQQVQSTLQTVPYPFEHARGQVTLAEYAHGGGNYANEVQAIYVECQTRLDRLFSLYFRILGRLVLIAEQVEAQVRSVGLPTEAPPEPPQT